jgi:hypothetical protein
MAVVVPMALASHELSVRAFPVASFLQSECNNLVRVQ